MKKGLTLFGIPFGEFNHQFNIFLKKIYYFNISKNLLNINLKKLHYNSYYTALPEINPSINAQRINQISMIEYFNQETRLDFVNSILYLSDPLSEEYNLSIDDELKLIVQIINDFSDNNIIVKFHPRDSEFKKNAIKKLIENELPIDLKNLPSEELISNYSFEAIVGTICTTLYYASLYTETPIFSYILVFSILNGL